LGPEHKTTLTIRLPLGQGDFLVVDYFS